MTIRWPIVGPLAALFAGAGLAALVLAFCAERGDETSTVLSSTRTPFSRPVTGTPTPRRATPSAVTPSEPTATASSGGSPAESTPEAPTPQPSEETVPPEETTPPEPESTLSPTEAPPAPSPTQTGGTPAITPSTSTPAAGPGLPDLVVLDMFVSNDRVGLSLGNTGEGELPARQAVEFLVRGVAAETVTLSEALLPGASVRIVFGNQVIYRPELVLAVADPNNVIAELDDDNNGLARQLEPDIALDLAVYGVFRAVDAPRLRVVVRNPTDAPAMQVTVAVSVFLGDATEAAAESTYRLTIEPQGFETVEVMGVAALPGTQVRVVVEMTDPPDSDPTNNVWDGTIS